MRRAWFVAAFVVPLLAGTVAAPSAPVGARAEVTFDFADGVSREDQAYIHEGIRLADDYFATTFGISVQEAVTVTVHAGEPTANFSAYAGGHHITFETGHPVWTGSSALSRYKIAVHEYFHVLQGELGGAGNAGAVWLTEGSAEYVAYQAVAAKGLISYDAVRDYHYYGVTYNPLLTVREMETSQGFSAGNQACCAISVSALAVEWVTAERGIKALRTFFEEVGAGTAWENAFQTAFGTTPEAFYTSFDAARAGFQPIAAIQAPFQLPTTFVEGVADITIIDVTSPAGRGEQAVLTAVTAPSIPCTLTFLSANGNELLVQPTHADPAGGVFWLWTVRERLARGTATVEVSCGLAPVTIGIDLT